MSRRLRIVVGIVGAAGVLLSLFRFLRPQSFEMAVAEGRRHLSDVPEPVLLALAVFVVICLWIAMMILVGRLLYWGWRQIDDYVLSLWDLLLPESPLVRFAVGLMIMIFLFTIGPLVVLQALEITQDDPLGTESDADTNATAENGTVDNGSADNSTAETTASATIRHNPGEMINPIRWSLSRPAAVSRK